MVTVNMKTLYKLTGHLSGTFWFRNVGPNLPKKDISGLKQKKQTPPLNSACLD